MGGPLNRFRPWMIVLLGAAIVCSCSAASETGAPERSATPEATGQDAVPVYTYRIVNSYPHDRGAFTQGLVFEEGALYEGTGLYGQSSLRKVELETGQVLAIRELADHFFGEGMTIFGDAISQLTWKANTGFVYDRDTLEPLGSFQYATEGWGLTHDGRRLIMSDGTSIVRFLDPETYEEIGRIEVLDGGAPVARLNELEYVGGELFANVWGSDRIARIDPATGRVVGWIDLAGLLSEEDRSEPVDVLNGIAYDEKDDRLFVTGKLWPRLFEIELMMEG